MGVLGAAGWEGERVCVGEREGWGGRGSLKCSEWNRREVWGGGGGFIHGL